MRCLIAAVLTLTLSAAGAAQTAVAADVATGRKVGWLTLDGPLRDGPVPFAWVGEAEAGPSLAGVIAQIDRVTKDPTYPGLVVSLDQPELSLSQMSALGAAMKRCRDAGKHVMAFAEAYDLNTYYLASFADSVLLQRKGGVWLTGMNVEEMYLNRMLGKIGVEPDFIQIGKYKGADEQFMRTEPSPAWDENFDHLLDGLYAATVDTIAANRGWTRADFEAHFRPSLTMTDDELLKAGLVDRLVARDLTTATEDAFGEDWAWDTELGAAAGGGLDTENPFALFSAIFREPSHVTRGDTLAVIHADGAIYSGESTVPGGFASDSTIGSSTMTQALEDALLDDNIKGVVIRLDSPGGSALASEVIWQAVREVQAEKPVYCVIGGMAASGGYYIASATDRVFVQPHSILGSIGVVAGKMTLKGVYDWAGVDVHRRGRGPLAGLFRSDATFDEDQRALLREAMTLTYVQFLDRVREGRGDRLTDLDAVDEGRLFTGRQSVDNGLADAEGGVDDALTQLARAAGLDDGGYDVLHLPRPLPLGEYLNKVFGGGVRSPIDALSPGAGVASLRGPLRTLVGAAAYGRVAPVLDGLMLLQREPVLTLLPAAVVVR